jgi:hypothetical protein
MLKQQKRVRERKGRRRRTGGGKEARKRKKGGRESLPSCREEHLFLST